MVLIIPALPLEWKQQELLISLVHPKRSKDYIFISFYGDGDRKAYPAVKHIYGPSKPIKAFECVVSV